MFASPMLEKRRQWADNDHVADNAREMQPWRDKPLQTFRHTSTWLLLRKIEKGSEFVSGSVRPRQSIFREGN
jgi:hypothetical protein